MAGSSKVKYLESEKDRDFLEYPIPFKSILGKAWMDEAQVLLEK